MRLGAIEGMVHTFFDELRQEGVRMPNGREFPRLFDFTREGALIGVRPYGFPIVHCLTD
jgi:glycogen synthase kinase 3 beta